MRFIRPARLGFLASLVLAACTDQQRPAVTDVESEVAMARAPAASNTLQINVAGLPAGALANVRVSGPRGFTQVVNASSTITGLRDGTYTVSATRVGVGSTTYEPSPASQTFNLRKGARATATVTYAVAPTTGSLAITINIGEPTPAPVTVTGPNAFSQPVPSTQTLSNLAAGTYTIAAPNFTAPSGVAYVSSAPSQSVTVTVGATASATVTYTGTTVPPGGLNLQVLGAVLTQATQTLANDVPLVAGRNAMLRVFAAANAATTSTPAVRARLYSNGALAATYTAPTPSGGVPTALNEGSANTSWNFAIPGSMIQPGLSVLVDVDPAGAVAESDENDNTWPTSGIPRPFDVRTVPALNVTLVPVLQSAGSLLGNVSTTNAGTFLTPLKDMFPLNGVNSSVRAAYTTSTALLSDGTGWSAVLSEISALRRADGSANHYYGVVKVTYGSGVAGMGYIGSPSSIGWDYLPSGSEVLAHEFGHNFGRYHGPCGGPSGVDGSYPYAGGIIGAWGFNVRTSTLIPRTNPDLMTYCGPEWISDYTYKGVLNFRGTATSAIVTAAAVEPGLLIWGRIAADGAITLEPSVRLTARPALPARSGSYTLDLTDASGGTIQTLSFDPELTDDHAGAPERHFAFVIPISEAAQARLQGIRVAGRGGRVERRARLSAAQVAGAADAITAESAGPGRTRIRWAAGAGGAEMVVVRDPRTGQVLSFARGGSVDLASPSAELELIASDGVRSGTRRTRVLGR